MSEKKSDAITMFNVIQGYQMARAAWTEYFNRFP